MTIPFVVSAGDQGAATPRPAPGTPLGDPRLTTPNPYVPPSGPSSYGWHRGGMVLAFGMVSLLVGLFGCACCAIVFPLSIGFGIAAVITGNADLKAMRGGRMDRSGEGTTQAGVVCGWIGIAFSILAVILTIISLVANIGAFDLQILNP